VAALLNLLYCELLKLKRSKILLISFLGALVAPTLMFVQGVKTHYSEPEFVISMEHFYENSTLYSMLMFGLIVYVVIGAYLFSREYTENTLKTIITVPVSKLSFITGKFIVFFILVIVLSIISWISIYGLSAIFKAMFGLEGFSIAIATKYFGRAIIGGMIMFVTMSPFAFLSLWTKGFVVPVISAASVAMVNVMLSNSDLGALFPWTASYLLISDGLTQTGYPYSLAISLIAVVSVFGFVVSVVYFQREDVK